MTIPLPVRWISLSLVVILSAKLTNQSWKRESRSISTTAAAATSSGEADGLISASYGILVVRSEIQEPEPQSELENYFIVHYNQQNIPRLKHDLKFFPLIDLLDSNDICYDSDQESDQFRDTVVVVKYETVLRCNISSQARDVEQRGARGLLIQLPRHVPVSDVQVGQHSTIDPFFLIAVISEKTTDSILGNDRGQRLLPPYYLSYENKTKESHISVSIFAPQTLDSTALIPFDLKILAVWVTAVFTLILGAYFSVRREHLNVKKKLPSRMDQRNGNNNSRTRRNNPSASEENLIHDTNSRHRNAAPTTDEDIRDGEDVSRGTTQRDADPEPHLRNHESDQNKSVLRVIFLISWLAVLPFVLFIFFNFIAYFMVAVFSVASIVILYVCCDYPVVDANRGSTSDKYSSGRSSGSGCKRRGHHHQNDGKNGENDAEQIASASTSSSNSASTITSLSVAKKLQLNHRPQHHQRSARGSLVRANAVTSESPASSVTGMRRGRLRRSNTSGSSETGSIEEDCLYYHRSQDSSIAVLHQPMIYNRFTSLHQNEPSMAKYNDRRYMMPSSRSCESAMSSFPSTRPTVHAVRDMDGTAIRATRPLHRSSSILKQSQNSSFETSDGQADTTTSRSLSRQTTFSNRDPDQEISVARPFLKSGFLEAAFSFDEENHKLVISVVQVSEICLSGSRSSSTSSSSSSPAHVVVHLALLPHKKQKHKSRVRLCSDDSCVKFSESFSFQRIDAEEMAGMGCRFRLYSCELLRRQSLIGEAVLSFASCKPLSSETKIMLTMEQKSRFSRCSSRTSDIGSAITRSDSVESTQLQRAAAELQLGLSYNSTTGYIQTSIIKGSNLSTATTRMPDTFVKLTLVSSSGNELAKRKSSVRKGNQNPLFEEVFVFQVPLFQLPDVTLVVSVYNKPNMKKKELIGWFSLGHNSSSESEISHWNEMRDNLKEQVCRWHVLHNS